MNGTQTEGIFRVSADVDEVAYWKARLDRWDVPEHKSTMGELTHQTKHEIIYTDRFPKLVSKLIIFNG